jgi:hypothetical protein
MVFELDDIPPCLMDVRRDSAWATMNVCQGIAWKTCTRMRWVCLDSLIVVVNRGRSWCLPDSQVPCCQVLLLQGCIPIQIFTTPSVMGEAFIESKCSNSTFILLYLYHGMDIDSLVADELVNILKLFDYTCMFSIGCKPIMITTQT